MIFFSCEKNIFFNSKILTKLDKMPKFNNLKFKRLNWIKVKFKDWNEFKSNLENVIYILAFFILNLFSIYSTIVICEF